MHVHLHVHLHLLLHAGMTSNPNMAPSPPRASLNIKASDAIKGDMSAWAEKACLDQVCCGDV
jgi:hypothetical protein